MGHKAGSNEASQNIKRDTYTDYEDSVSTVCDVSNTNENLRSWTLGSFSRQSGSQLGSFHLG